ncbi:ROK family protein [Peredibacter sp. HCB2-198]|uniref:ROK family protein n=1 Tax=Peredibacter sp. HCB2-198 TaxID=3383025 RepID=UPI0038B4E954
MKNEHVAFGIDIGGTNTKIGLFDQSGNLLAFHTLPTDKTMSPEQFIEQLARESQRLLSTELKIELGDSRILGLGAGAPVANYYTGRIEHAPNLGWTNVPLRDLFQEKFKCQAVIENDANLAAVGENRWGAGKDLKDFVLITLGTGVGTGLILDGKLYRGHNALGAEGGHIIIPHDKKRLCSCGGLNHLESYLSAKGIKQTIHELTGEEWKIEKLGTLFKEKDLRATTIIHTIADELVSGLVSIAVLFGPQAFVIGGGVSKLGDSFNQVLKKKLDELVHFSLTGKIDIVTASLSSDKGAVYGGAAHIFDEVLK